MINELRLQALQLSYDAMTPVFAPVTEYIRRGEVVAVTGNNGAGKSTLLAGVCGLIQPFGGRVDVVRDGGETEIGFNRAHCGYASPAMSLYDELTAWEQVEFDAKVRDCVSLLPHAAESFGLFGLQARRDSFIGDFSTGMKQRLKLILATYFEPDVLLLDEPSSNLDDEGFEVMARHIRWAADRGCIVLVATNDERDRALCGREFRLTHDKKPTR